MTLKEKIEQTLQATREPNIDKLLHYMEENGFYSCRCASHNHWEGGTSQHVWAVYLIAKALRDKRIAEPAVARYATDSKLAIVCLLHDLCDMSVSVYAPGHGRISGHGYKSYWILRNFQIGTPAEQMVVCNHMHDNSPWTSGTPDEVEEYNVLHSLIRKADHQASGTAWNSTRYKEGRTQKKGCPSDANYIRAVALDRTVQSGNYHLYIDQHYELQEFRNYNRDNIGQCAREVVDNLLKDTTLRIPMDNGMDAISAAHDYFLMTGEHLCLVVGADPSIPQDRSTRLRQGNHSSQDILICSNLLNSFYSSQVCMEKGTRRFRYEFTMRDENKRLYRECSAKKSALYLHDVMMIRDGEKRGYPFIEPWPVDLLLVFGEKYDTFAIPTECSYLLKSQKYKMQLRIHHNSHL